MLCVLACTRVRAPVVAHPGVRGAPLASGRTRVGVTTCACVCEAVYVCVRGRVRVCKAMCVRVCKAMCVRVQGCVQRRGELSSHACVREDLGVPVGVQGDGRRLHEHPRAKGKLRPARGTRARGFPGVPGVFRPRNPQNRPPRTALGWGGSLGWTADGRRECGNRSLWAPGMWESQPLDTGNVGIRVAPRPTPPAPRWHRVPAAALPLAGRWEGSDPALPRLGGIHPCSRSAGTAGRGGWGAAPPPRGVPSALRSPRCGGDNVPIYPRLSIPIRQLRVGTPGMVG